MGRSVNKITLIGNVGRNPDIHTTKAGTKVVHLSLATNRRTGREGDQEERTDWHRLTFWGRLAEFAADHVRVGARLYVEGRMEYDSYERDKVSIPTAEVHVREVVLLSPRETLLDEEHESSSEAEVVEVGAAD